MLRELAMETPLSSPTSLDALARIEAKLDRLEHRLARFDALAESMPGLLAILGDTFDEYAREQTERGVDVEQVMRNLGRTLDALLRLAAAPAAPGSKIGAFGLLRELRDPDVQRALGFAVDVARRLGHQLREGSTP
jgi:uncharacterized protein YjgD (DUF1641 family)